MISLQTKKKKSFSPLFFFKIEYTILIILQNTIKMSIQDALIKVEYKELTVDIIAKYNGFTDVELEMLKMFWNRVFNDGWIYLSKIVIIDAMRYKKISNFYKETLRMYYIENIDYKEISKDDDLINKYNDFANEGQSELAKPKHTGGKAQKYYAITCNTFLDLIKKSEYRLSRKKSLIQEKNISDKLSLLLNGKREVYISETRQMIDILTDTEIIEVKRYSNRLASVGQILYYGKYYNNRKMRIHLFNHDNQKDTLFEEICNHLNITITYE
jgi:hypothetical protein